MYTDTHILQSYTCIQQYAQTKQNTYMQHNNMHTICTQFAHTQTQNTTIMQHTEDNTKNSTENKHNIRTQAQHKIQQYAVHTTIVHIV